MSSSAVFTSTALLTAYNHPDHPFSSWPALPATPLGRLALLTPDMTAKAAHEEILTGERLSLDYTVYPSGALMYTRKAAEHTVFRCDGGPVTREEAEKQGKTFNPCFDDEVHFNTQGTTQWDYFMHFSYHHSGLFYGGLTVDQIQSQKTGEFGIAAIARAGGVQTRALLVDLPLYLSKKGLAPIDPLLASTTIDLDTLLLAMEYFKLIPRPGDVLLVRTGFENALAEDRARDPADQILPLQKGWAGVKRGKDVATWIWQNGFVAVGSDNPTFEEWPQASPTAQGVEKLSLHMILLSGMGIMIGELLRLNALADACERRGRWSFFFSSNPLMIEHGIASPPNAVAIL